MSHAQRYRMGVNQRTAAIERFRKTITTASISISTCIDPSDTDDLLTIITAANKQIADIHAKGEKEYRAHVALMDNINKPKVSPTLTLPVKVTAAQMRAAQDDVAQALTKTNDLLQGIDTRFHGARAAICAINKPLQNIIKLGFGIKNSGIIVESLDEVNEHLRTLALLLTR
jgi:hypothetical protein